MTTETIREAGQYRLIKGFGAGWNIFDTERQISTDWDSDAQWVHYMQSLDMDDFEAECETLIEAELEHYTECDYCETLTDDPWNSCTGSYCSSDCRADGDYLSKQGGDPNREHRTY